MDSHKHHGISVIADKHNLLDLISASSSGSELPKCTVPKSDVRSHEAWSPLHADLMQSWSRDSIPPARVASPAVFCMTVLAFQCCIPWHLSLYKPPTSLALKNLNPKQIEKTCTHRSLATCSHDGHQVPHVSPRTLADCVRKEAYSGALLSTITTCACT